MAGIERGRKGGERDFGQELGLGFIINAPVNVMPAGGGGGGGARQMGGILNF